MVDLRDQRYDKPLIKAKKLIPASLVHKKFPLEYRWEIIIPHFSHVVTYPVFIVSHVTQDIIQV